MSLTKLHSRLSEIQSFTPKPDVTGYFLQDILKFISVAGTLTQPGSGLNLGPSAAVDERYFTHPIFRSLLENYFLNLWLFDDLTASSARYDEVLAQFATEYGKLWDALSSDPAFAKFMAGAGATLCDKSALVPTKGSLRNVHDMLVQVKRYNGTRATDLYPLYRIASFDTHGRSLAAIMEKSFGGTGINFPILDVRTGIDQMAVDYEIIVDDLKNRSLI